MPVRIRGDTGPEFAAKAVRTWLDKVGMKTLLIEPYSPWENGYMESLNGKLRDEPLDRKVFETLLESRMLIERWRKHYNTVRPHSSLGYRPPAPETIAARPHPPLRSGLPSSGVQQAEHSHRLWTDYRGKVRWTPASADFLTSRRPALARARLPSPPSSNSVIRLPRSPPGCPRRAQLSHA